MSEKEFNPKVSIIIPVYNGSNYLENAINCALNQTYENIEIIVVNDGSRDDGATERVALSFGDRIRYYSKPNGGVSTALNFGIRHMTGDYFSWLSHDDAYSPTKVADGVALLRKLPAEEKKTIAYTFGHFIDKDGQLLRPFSHQFTPGRRYSGIEMAEYSCRKGTLNGCCMLIPREAFEEFGGLNEKLRYSQDSLMWFTLFFGGYGLISDHKDNVMYRLHGTQVSRTRRDLFEQDSAYIAKVLAPSMAAHSGDGRKILYLYALRMAKYHCEDAVRTLKMQARKGRAFSLLQNAHISCLLFYGNIRGTLKRLYYHFILKVDA